MALYYVIIGCVISGVMFVMASDMAANSEDKWAIAICILVGIIFLIQCLWYAISALRIVTLTENGCEIRVWRISRFHTWDQLWFRKWHDYGDRYVGMRLNKWRRGYVWMSLSPVDLPERPRTMRDQMLEEIDPLSRIRIHIVEADRVGDVFHGLRVERSQFLHFIDSIGLKIQDIDMIR